MVNLTKNDIIKAFKRILSLTKDCKFMFTNYLYNAFLRNSLFSKHVLIFYFWAKN